MNPARIAALTGSADPYCRADEAARHSGLELIVVTAGRVHLAVEGRVLRLGEATLCWIFQDQHCGVLSRSPDLEGFTVLAGPRVVEVALGGSSDPSVLRRPESLMPLIYRISAGDLRWVYDRLLELKSIDSGEDAESERSATVGLAYVLLRAWQAGIAGHDPRPTASAAVLQAARLLDEPAVGPVWSTSNLARTVGVSAGHLARRFRAEMGCTLTDYRLHGQLNRYLDLSDDDHTLSITDAAYGAGFGSYAQFHRVFVRLMGASPSEHRLRRRGRQAGEGLLE